MSTKSSINSATISQLEASIERNLKVSILDGALFSFMVGVGETFLPAFVLALGLGDVAAGLVTVLPMLVGATLQLISPRAVRELGSHKKWVIACAMIQALSFLPMVALALNEKKSSIILFLSVVLYWTGGLGSASAWNTWMSKTVPSNIRTRYFAKRSRICHLGVLIGLIIGAQIAQKGKMFEHPLYAFALMFALGMIARWISIYYLGQQTETKEAIGDQEFPHPIKIFKEMATTKEGKILKYLLFTQVVVHISAPYFAPYMLSQLELDYEQYMVLVCTSFLARALVLPLVGRYAGHFSATRLLKLGGLLIAPMPLLWIFSSDYIYLLFAQAAGGASWAIFELGMTLSFFEGIPEKKRTSVLTSFSFANAIAMTVGSLIGGQILTYFGTSSRVYFILFITSSALRLVSLVFLRGLPDIRTGFRLIASKVLAVRPTMGAVDKPVVSTIGRDSRSVKKP